MDPHETDRRFRERIAQWDEEQRQRGWRAWLRRIASVAALLRPSPLLGVFGGILAFGGLFVLFFGTVIKFTDVYACSIAEARRSPAVTDELGESIEAGFFAWCPSYAQQGSVTDATYSTTLRGTKGEGTLHVWWYNSPVGSSLRMELDRNGKRTVVHTGAIPCR